MTAATLRGDMLRAGLIYGGGDSLAALLTGQFAWPRAIAITLLGALLYAPEIRAWFAWIARRIPEAGAPRAQLQRTLLALAWFNPLWIARHALFIRLADGRWQQIDAGLLTLGLATFLCNLPVALLANWLIQNRVPLRWRLTASALFSAAMAVWYALAETWLG